MVIDVSAEVAAERRGGRGGGEELFEAQAIQRRLAQVYANASELVPGDRVVHVRGQGAVEVVAGRVLQAYDAAFAGSE